MSKPIFKIIDDKGRVLIPAPVRKALGLRPGDIVGVTAERGRVALKKAIVVEDGNIPQAAKEAYVEAVMRELPSDRLTDLLELAVRLIREGPHA